MDMTMGKAVVSSTRQNGLWSPPKGALNEGAKIIDIGCGMNKYPGAFGVDIHPYEGVDLVVDVNKTPWDIPSESFDLVVSQHVIEHVDNVTQFMKEIHRISRPGALIRIETPHFSSFNSWNDPTHKAHFSSRWYENFLPGRYLAAQSGAFELVQTEVTFGQAPRNKIGSLIAKWRGLDKWEKNSAFSFPGMDIKTTLRRI